MASYACWPFEIVKPDAPEIPWELVATVVGVATGIAVAFYVAT